MTLPKKKRRTLIIDEEKFHWIVGKQHFEFYKRTNASATPIARNRLTIVIEASSSGAKILAEFHGLYAVAVPSLGFENAQDLVITPNIIKKIIAHAKDEFCWDPGQKGFHITINHAQRIIPESVWDGFKEIDLGYDPKRIDDYLKNAVRIYPE
jgi:hypothetical protein